MNFQITLSNDIDFAPSNETAEILQNVKTILATRKGTVPLERDFGISWEHLDAPIPVVKSLSQADIIDAENQYEPRAKVQSVEFDDDLIDAKEGLLHPRVIVTIGDEEEAEDE